MNSHEKDRFVLELSDYIHNRFKKEGKLKRILEYNPILEEGDIYNSIVVSVLEFLRNLDSNLLPTNGKNKHTLFYSAYKHSLKVFTEYVQEGSEQIYRVVKTREGHKMISDRRFQTLKRKYSRLDAVSKRNTCSIDNFNSDEDNRRDFFEKNYAKFPEVFSSSSYTPCYDEKTNDNTSETKKPKVFTILEKLKVMLKTQVNQKHR